MPFLALLKLVSPREWLLIAALCALGVWSLHVYHAGEMKIEKKDLALRAAQTTLNTALENAAEINEIQIGKTYEKIILQSVPNAPGLVCHNSAPVKSETTGNRSGVVGAQTQLPDGGFNPSGELLTLLRDDDAQIDGLIDTVLNLEAELQGKR